MWPHMDLTSASCCVPCRHAVPTVCLLDHSSTTAHSGDVFFFFQPQVEVTEQGLSSYDLIQELNFYGIYDILLT